MTEEEQTPQVDKNALLNSLRQVKEKAVSGKLPQQFVLDGKHIKGNGSFRTYGPNIEIFEGESPMAKKVRNITDNIALRAVSYGDKVKTINRLRKANYFAFTPIPDGQNSLVTLHLLHESPDRRTPISMIHLGFLVDNNTVSQLQQVIRVDPNVFGEVCDAVFPETLSSLNTFKADGVYILEPACIGRIPEDVSAGFSSQSSYDFFSKDNGQVYMEFSSPYGRSELPN